jgi:DNA sulfur modification protein DndC
MDFCRKLLRKLLETQKQVAREAPAGDAPILIHEVELHEIRRLWRTERGDWPDSVPRIVRETLGLDLDWVSEDAVAFTADDGELLDTICEANDVPTGLVMKLLDIERAAHGLKRRHSVHTRIEDAFRFEWRELDTIVAERRQKLGMDANGQLILDADETELSFDAEEDDA